VPENRTQAARCPECGKPVLRSEAEISWLIGQRAWCRECYPKRAFQTPYPTDHFRLHDMLGIDWMPWEGSGNG
jgi:hypothetical protein